MPAIVAPPSLVLVSPTPAAPCTAPRVCGERNESDNDQHLQRIAIGRREYADDRDKRSDHGYDKVANRNEKSISMMTPYLAIGEWLSSIAPAPSEIVQEPIQQLLC